MSEESRHEGMRGVVDKAEDAVAGAVGMASAATTGSHGAKEFVTNAAVSNLYELEAARIALRRSTSAAVRQVAERMIRDHTEMGDRLRRTAEKAGLSEYAPSKLDDRRRGMIENLDTAPEQEFDERYLRQQGAAHKEAITLFEGFAEHGENPELKPLAGEAVPILKQHLEAVKSAAP